MNLLTWLEQCIPEGAGRLELWQFGERLHKCVKQWPLQDGQKKAASLAVEILALVGAPRRRCASHVIFVYDGKSDDGPARARALLRDGILMTNARWSSSLLDSLLEDVLAQCEDSARLRREIERVSRVRGMPSRSRRR